MVDEDNNLSENIIEEGDYSRKSDFSKASIVEAGVRKVQETRGREMKAGYFNIVYLNNGTQTKVYIDDTRKQYIGSVEYLLNILSAEIATDKRMKPKIKEYEERRDKIFNKYSINKVIFYGGQRVELNSRFIPEIDQQFSEVQKVSGGYAQASKKQNITITGLYNDNVKHYWDEMVVLTDFLFSELNILIANKNYFKAKTGM